MIIFFGFKRSCKYRTPLSGNFIGCQIIVCEPANPGGKHKDCENVPVISLLGSVWNCLVSSQAVVHVGYRPADTFILYGIPQPLQSPQCLLCRERRSIEFGQRMEAPPLSVVLLQRDNLLCPFGILVHLLFLHI